MSDNTTEDGAEDGQETYQVSLIDPDSGDGWGVEVEAESPQEAIQEATEQADGQPGSFIRANMEVDQ